MDRACAWTPGRLLLSLVLLLFAAFACGTGATATAPPSASAVRAAIEAARDEGVSFHLLAQCIDEKGNRSLEVFPSGVAVWNGSLQVTVAPPLRRALLDNLLAGGFPAMKASYGGKRPPPPGSGDDAAAALQVRCRLSFESGGVDKTSIQQAQGEQSPALTALIASLLDHVQPLAKQGVGAEDLADGLALLARGELAPETFTMRFVRLPPKGAPGAIVRVERGSVVRQRYAPGRTFDEATSEELDGERFAALLAAVRSADLASMPANLWSEDQLEVEVRVLDHEAIVLARSFARLNAGDGGDAQQRFDALVGFLRRELLAEEGETAAGPREVPAGR